MVALAREPSVVKRFFSGTFAPPAGFASDVRGAEVTAAEILAGGVRESDWSFPILVSTPNEDRQGDIVVSEGCDYTAFAQSPIVMFDHGEVKFPVGKMRGPDGRLYFLVIPGVGILGRVWIRQPQPDDPPSYAEACKTVWVTVRDGLLNGVSCGFDPVGPVKELPSGGILYKRWELLEVTATPIAANRECRVLREPFAPSEWDQAVLKRFTPSVIKGLRSMTTTIAPPAAKGQHHNTHDIKFRDGEWTILDNKTRKPLSHHKTRAEAVAAMRALQAHKSHAAGVSKGMSESSGTSGGYAVPEEHAATCKAIADRMKDHDATGHSVYFHPESGDLRHSYPDAESEDKVKSVAADLSDIPGVKAVTQEPEAGRPKGEGYHKVYPCKDMAGGDADTVEDAHRSHVEKRAHRMARIGKAAFRAVRKGKISGWLGKSLERSARRVMPTLLAAKMDEGRAVRVAWGIAAVKKGLLPLVQKAVDGGSDDDEDGDDATPADASVDASGNMSAEDAADNAATDAAMDAETEGGDGPEGLELVQAAIENLEAALPRLEPERRAFWQGIIDQVRDHGEETYPDEDFGGADDAGAEGAAAGANNDADEQAVTDEMLSRYKGFRPQRVKRVSIARKLKSMQRDPEATEAIRKAANHLHEIGDMEVEPGEKGCRLKGYTPAHHRQARIRARELDRLHGALTKGESPGKGDDKPGEGGSGGLEDQLDFDAIDRRLKSTEALVGRVAQKAGEVSERAGLRRSS